MLKEDNSALGFPSFRNGDVVLRVVGRMSNDQTLREWELYTLEEMRWNDNHKRAIEYWSLDIIKSRRRLMQQPA